MRGGKSFIALLGVAAALAGYIYFIELGRDPSDAPEKKDKVFTIEAGKLEELEIKAASGETTTLKKQGEAWQIVTPAGLEADQAEVSPVASTLESLEMQRSLEDNPASVAQYGLEPPRLSVGFRAAGDTTMRRLLLGKKTPTGGDIYARVEGQPKVFLISAYLEDSLNKTPFNLRDKAALKIERVGVDALTLEAAGSPALAFARKDAEWRFTRPTTARADFSAVDNIIGKVAQAKMKSLELEGAAGKDLPAADLKKYGLDKPQATATLGVGSTRATLAIGTKKDDTSVYARDLSRPIVFTVEANVLDDFKLKPADLRKKDLFEFRSFTAVGMDLSLGKDAGSFAKVREEPKPEEGKGKEKDKAKADEPPPAPVEKWKQTKPAAKDVDQSKMTDLLTTISNLRADTFADKALASGEELVVTAHFGDPSKPQTEKVTFRRSGTTVHAIVAGEPGAAVVPTADYDKVVSLFKELAAIK